MDSLKTDKIRLDKQGDAFINKTAAQTLTSTTVVERVMNFHFRDLIRAFKTYKSIEITGFGRFEISPNKVKNTIIELEVTKARLELKEDERSKQRVIGLDKDLAFLQERNQLYETKFQGYYRRMAQSLAPSREVEGVNPAD